MYWTDIGAHAKTGRVRGRIILPGARSTSDFDVALDGANKPRIFSLVASGVSCAAPCHYWYGDYQTASGYQTVHVVPGGIAPAYDFFPMWIEPDGAVHYTLAARKRLGAAQDGIAICPLQCRVARAKSGVGQGCGVNCISGVAGRIPERLVGMQGLVIPCMSGPLSCPLRNRKFCREMIDHIDAADEVSALMQKYRSTSVGADRHKIWTEGNVVEPGAWKLKAAHTRVRPG